MRRHLCIHLALLLGALSCVSAANIVWNHHGTAWEDAKNWAGGQVPGADDIAVFPDVGTTPTSWPVVTGSVRVAGLVLGTTPEGNVPIPLTGRMLSGWVINGAGAIAVGKSGIVMHAGSSIIHPALELTVDQTWSIGGWSQGVVPTEQLSHYNSREFVDVELMILKDWGVPDFCNLVIYGAISGAGSLHKTNNGKVFVVNNNSPSFSGGTRISAGTLSWVQCGLTHDTEGHFGTGTIVLDRGFFNFSTDDTCVNTASIRLTNELMVTGRGGAVQCSQAGLPEKTARSLFAGPLELRGVLTVGRQGNGYIYPELVGPITVYQAGGATPGISCTAWVSMGKLALPGRISDGPGNAGNPLVLRNYCDGITVLNSHNSYSGATIGTYTGGEEGFANRIGIVYVAPAAKLGAGDLWIEPGGQVRLSAPGNLSSHAQAIVEGNPLALGVLTVWYNGVPALSADSAGVLAVDCQDFDALTDLSKLGNGRMRLGGRGCGDFTGERLAPGADNLYRLGGGSSGGAVDKWGESLRDVYQRAAPRESNPGGLLKIEHGVLQGTAGVEVGAPGRLGNGAVLLKGPNTFTGPLTVQGADETHENWGWPGSILEGLAQTRAGDSPFGAPTGAVRLLNSTLRLTGVAGGQPASKGALTFAGCSTISLNTDKNFPVSLSVTDLLREDRAALMVLPLHATLGKQVKLTVTGWTRNVDLLPPYMLGPLDFLSYDAIGGNGVCRAAPSATDLRHATATDIVTTGADTLTGGEYTARALKTTGDITGIGIIKLTSGGLILGGHIDAQLDFANAEGVICAGHGDPYILRGKVSGHNGLTMLTTTMHSFHEGLALLNTNNDISGPITVNDCLLVAVLDKREKDGSFTAGSLGDLHNELVLNGALLAMANNNSGDGCLAPTRTIYLGPGGAVLVPPAYMPSIAGSHNPDWYTIYGKITGPGSLTSNNNASPRIIIANGENDYSGGTWVVPQEQPEWRVTPAGKLGTGPVLVATECCLTLQGDNNIDAGARLTVSTCGLAVFQSAHPTIGSLEGCGYIDLGVKSVPPSPTGFSWVGQDTTLTVGSDNSDFTFWGTIRQVGDKPGDGIGALTKIGKGVFTLRGGQTFTGATTVEEGTLILKGSVTGDVIVKKGAQLILQGKVAGKVTVEHGGKLQDEHIHSPTRR